MSDAEEIKGSLQMWIDKLIEVNTQLSGVVQELGEMQGGLLLLGAKTGSNRLGEAFSLVGAARESLGLDLANLNLVGSLMVTARDDL